MAQIRPKLDEEHAKMLDDLSLLHKGNKTAATQRAISIYYEKERDRISVIKEAMSKDYGAK